ncbi:MAG: rod shape-determining protein MreC [Verrucomicrobiota bacterium]
MRLLNQISGQARPFFTLGVVSLAWLLVPAVVKRFVRNTLFEAQAPALVTAGRVRQLQEYWALRSRSTDELIANGNATAAALAGYELGVARLEQAMDENSRLRILLNLRPMPGWRYEHAGVMAREFSAWWQQLVIDKGADYGIPLDAPVVFAGGVVGRVREVHMHTAVVALVSDPGVRLAVVVEGDPRHSTISYTGGDNPAFGPARGTVEYLPADITVPADGRGQRLLTSGNGGVFPAGLPVGLLMRVEPSPDGLFQTGEVLLPTKLSALDEVTVLVPDPAAAGLLMPAARGIPP